MINIEDFKNLVIPALQDMLNKSKAKAPTTKVVSQYSSSIADMTFDELSQYVKEHNIPTQAFVTIQKEYGFLGEDEHIVFEWHIKVPTTAEEKEDAIKRWVNTSVSFRAVSDALTKNGYKRVGVNSINFKKYRDTTVYDMCINREFDRLHEYYSLFFEKK